MFADVVAISNHWGLDIKEIKKLSDRVTLLITKKEEKYVLKKKGKLQDIANEFELLQHLNSNKISVHLPLINNYEEFIFTFNGEKFCIYNYLDGHTFSAIESLHNPIAPVLLGKTIASLHKVMNNLTIAEKFTDKDLYNMVYGWGVKEIFKVDLDENLKSIYDSLETVIKNNIEGLPKQLIHRDAHIFNIIYNDGQLSGVIDFDIVEVNVRIFDICYCSTSILSEVFNKRHLREIWINFVGELVDKYRKINPLKDIEINSMWYVMLCIQTIFMAYFASYSEIFNINKEMFLWIYENRKKIEKNILDSIN